MKINTEILIQTARDFFMLCGAIAIAVYLPNMAKPIAILTAILLIGVFSAMYAIRAGLQMQKETSR